jgi:hypothetical protein
MVEVREMSKKNSRFWLLYHHARPLLFLLVGIVVAGVALALYTFFFQRRYLVSYLLYLMLPSLIATLGIFWTLYSSEYLRVAVQLGAKRVSAKAGLGFIQSSKGAVLLNLQTEDPWKNSWILPGGYYSKEKDNGYQETAQRRARLLINDENLVAHAKIASTKDSPEYRLTVLDAGHAPTYDFLYEVGYSDHRPIHEEDIIQTNNLRWFGAEDLRSLTVPIPPHMRDIVSYLIGGDEDGPVGPKFWELDDAWLASRLEQMTT